MDGMIDSEDPRVLATTLEAKALRLAKRQLAEHFRHCQQLHAEYQLAFDHALQASPRTARGRRKTPWPNPPVTPPFPNGYRALPCGAKTRSGTPCKLITIFSNGRCKLHGGLSTGPRTREGKSRALANLRQHRTP
jgi:hypothetical protein